MEKINFTSALPGNEPFQIAHTRGKTVMKEAIPLPDEPVDPAGFKKGEPSIWYGKSIDEKSLKNTMKNGTKACIDNCTAFGFPFLKDCVYDHIPRTSSKAEGHSEEDDQQDEDVCLEDDLSMNVKLKKMIVRILV